MDPHAFIQAYLDDELTDGQFAELSAWLAASEANRDAFVQATNLDTAIHRQLANADLHAFLEEVDIHAIQDVLERSQEDSTAAMLSITDSEMQVEEVMTVGRAMGVLTRSGAEVAGQLLRRHASKLSIAAVLVIVGTIALIFAFNQAPEQPSQIIYKPSETTPVTLAYVTDTHRAKWAGQPLGLRDALTQGSYELRQGSVQIEMISGTKTLIQAPAKFTLNGSNQIALHAGTLDAQVPRWAIGFTVETPDARIVDIGTEFNVTIDEQAGQSQVAVHLGKVLASSSDPLIDQPPTAVTAGQAVAVGADAQLHEAAYVPGSFDRAIVASRYQPTVTEGTAVFDSLVPDDFRQGKQISNKVQVYLERADVLLEQDVSVNMTGTDRWPTATVYPMKADQRVDIYLLHMDMTGLPAEERLHTLDFGRPILGVICKHELLQQTDILADPSGSRRFDNKPDSIGELLRGIEFGDAARLLPDGTSLQIKFSVKHKTDQVRVLVQALPED